MDQPQIVPPAAAAAAATSSEVAKVKETEFGCRSMSPPAMDDYRSAAADSTTRNSLIRNSDPPALGPMVPPNVPVLTSYSEVSPSPHSVYGPPPSKKGGYVNGGHFSRSRQPVPEPPPVDVEERLGVGEVDFDQKYTEAYAVLGDVQRETAAYHMAHSQPSSPERALNRGVINYTVEKRTRGSSYCCCLCVIILILFVAVMLALALGIYNFLQDNSNGLDTPPAQLSSNNVSLSPQQLKEELDEIRLNFISMNEQQNSSLQRLQEQLNVLLVGIAGETTTQATTAINETSTETTTVETKGGRNVNVSLYTNCTTEIEGRCQIETHTIPEKPSFKRCGTTPASLNHPDSHVTNVFCTVNQDQITPVISNLIFENNRWSCACTVILIANEIMEISSQAFECQLQVTRCPLNTVIPLN